MKRARRPFLRGPRICACHLMHWGRQGPARSDINASSRKLKRALLRACPSSLPPPCASIAQPLHPMDRCTAVACVASRVQARGVLLALACSPHHFQSFILFKMFASVCGHGPRVACWWPAGTLESLVAPSCQPCSCVGSTQELNRLESETSMRAVREQAALSRRI